MIFDILTGKTKEHLVPLEGTKFLIHHQMLNDFLKLQASAANDGFDLQIVSAFRDYERQLTIWNRKVNASEEDAEKTIFNILRWSALPGASRHHWGTDIDVFDGSTQKKEDVKLEPEEVEGEGPAAKLHDWLDEKISLNQAFGFYRPYANDLGGVAPERWHLSYSPLSSKFFEQYSFEKFVQNISESQMLLKDDVLDYADEIYQKFFLNISFP